MELLSLVVETVTTSVVEHLTEIVVSAAVAAVCSRWRRSPS